LEESGPIVDARKRQRMGVASFISLSVVAEKFRTLLMQDSDLHPEIE